MLSLILLLLTLSILEVSTKPDYYWRRFYGQVPFDAVVGAHIDQGTIYIGRASFEKQGMLVGPIIDCSRNITVTTWSAFSDRTLHSVDKFTEILCSPLPHTHFRWIPATAETVLAHKGWMVEGGYESIGRGKNNGALYIGRIKDGEQAKIGKVAGYYYDNEVTLNRFYYADDQQERWSYSFQVLVYDYNKEPRDKMCPLSPRNIWPQEYYWRKFDGEIPYDAFSVSTNRDIFIGRAPFERRGLLVGPINRSSRKVAVTMNSDVHYLDQFAEILCFPHPRRFGKTTWVAASPESLLSKTGLVEGGFQFSADQKHDGALYIGGKRGDNNIYGKVVGYFKDDVKRNRFYYDQDGREGSDSDYWVLTYHHPAETLFNDQRHHPTETPSNDDTEKRIVSSSSKITINTIA